MPSIAETPLSRRKLFRVSGALTAKAVIDAAFPNLARAEVVTEWNPITVKQGDVLWSICNFYNVRQNEVVEINRLSNPNIIFPGQTLWLPADTNHVEMPFRRLFLTGNRQITTVSLINDKTAFLTDCQEMILYEKDYPYVLSGHSSPDNSLSDYSPFHPLLRNLLNNRKLELRFWLERSDGSGFVEGVLSGTDTGHSAGYEEIVKLANSRNLIFRTCAVETPLEKDELYCLAPITNYRSAGPEN